MPSRDSVTMIILAIKPCAITDVVQHNVTVARSTYNNF